MGARAKLRKLVRDVLENHPPFAGYKVLRSWVENIDPSQVPLLGVYTPRERIEGSTGNDVAREAELHVHAVIKAEDADDLEDLMDDVASDIEAVVMAALKDRDQPLFGLVSIDFDPRTYSAERIGSVLLQFRETRYEPEINF